MEGRGQVNCDMSLDVMLGIQLEGEAKWSALSGVYLKIRVHVN